MDAYLALLDLAAYVGVRDARCAGLGPRCHAETEADELDSRETPA